MVVKQVAAKKGTGSFGGLANYLLDRQNGGKKVYDFEFKNCSFEQDRDLNLKEIQITTNLNQRAKSDKVLHLVVSFHEDEHPSKEQLQFIEQELAKAIGMQEHQRLIVSHKNTNNFHMHIAINKIHPQSKKLIDPSWSKKRLSQKAFELEEKFGFKQDQNQLIPKIMKQALQEIKFKKGENSEQKTEQAAGAAQVHKFLDREARGREQTKSINDLRTLSGSDMVHNTNKLKVLLQDDDGSQLGYKRGDRANNRVRRADNSAYADEKSRINDEEIHSGIKNFSTWIKEEVLEDLQSVVKNNKATFEDLQWILAEANLELKLRGNGVVIAHKSRKLFVKSSSIHRNLSKAKLERRFGKPLVLKSIDIKPKREFGKPKHDLWKRYKEQSDTLRATKQRLLTKARLENIEAKETIKSKYMRLIAKTKRDLFLAPKAKRNIYRSLYLNRKKEYQELSKAYKAKRDKIHKQTNQISYKEFLIQKSLMGDSTALAALRKSSVKLEPQEKAILGKTDHTIFITKDPHITKQGLVVYHIGNHGKIIDKGDRLRITIDGDELAIKEMLEMSILKYGKNLDISGDITFKQKVLAITEKYDLKISFKDKTMQEIYKASQKRKQTKKRRAGQKRDKRENKTIAR